MCGVNGFVGNGKSPVDAINRALTHRGPDFAGTYTNDGIALGHLLLSIRETADASKQPITKPGSPWVLIFNGQIYNTGELSKKFSIPYHDLDTTMVFDLIEKKGWEFVRHIQGMFAIALYNEHEKILRLYRDQSGQKPIYYSPHPGAFVFASEIKGIFASGVKAETNPEGLQIAGALGYIPGHLTLFKNIYKLDAGEVVSVKQDGSFERSYYESDTQRFEGEPKQIMEELVTEHLASKQRVALNLSGGMDSSVLLHEMKTAGHELTTYTTSFADAGEAFNDDAHIARMLSKDYGTRHTEIQITKDIYLANFIKSYELIEEPNYNISLPTYLEVAKREGVAGDGNRVILSGDGGDELFGGYPYYARSAQYQRLMSQITPLGFNIGKWTRTGRYFDYGNPVEKWLAFKQFDFTAFPRNAGFVKQYFKQIASERALPLKDPVRSQMVLDRAFWMPGENFIRSDKLYMSETLEMRSPLSYEPLRAYFDARLKTEDYTEEGGLPAQAGNKRFLRKLYTNILPDYIVKREAKTGWRSPVRPWYDKKFKDLFLSILSDAPKGGQVQWGKIIKEIEAKDTWPGKYFFLYLSLAILSKKHNIVL